MFSWIRYYIAEVCALQSALRVLIGIVETQLSHKILRYNPELRWASWKISHFVYFLTWLYKHFCIGCRANWNNASAKEVRVNAGGTEPWSSVIVGEQDGSRGFIQENLIPRFYVSEWAKNLCNQSLSNLLDLPLFNKQQNPYLQAILSH